MKIVCSSHQASFIRPQNRLVNEYELSLHNPFAAADTPELFSPRVHLGIHELRFFGRQQVTERLRNRLLLVPQLQ